MILYKVKRIAWEVALLKNMVQRGKDVQWYTQAQPELIRQKSTKEILMEALCVNMGDADTMVWRTRLDEIHEVAQEATPKATPTKRARTYTRDEIERLVAERVR